jgi:hypothetical protein
MANMTTAQRHATKRYRERHRKLGFKRVEVLVPTDSVAAIRTAAAILRDGSGHAASLRRHLGSAAKPNDVQSAIDAFAMTEPLSERGQMLWDEAMAQVERDRRNPALNRARAVDL